MPARWRRVEGGDWAELAKARSEAINVVQWLVRVANSFVAAGTMEQRIELEFRAADAAIVTKPFESNLLLEMRLPTLEMQFLENGKLMPHILDPEEHSPAEVEAWLLVELLHRGVDRTKFSKTLPYAVPGLLTGDAEDYSPQSCRQGLMQLMIWLQNGAAVLAAGAGTGDGSRIICEPQTLGLSYPPYRGSGLGDVGFSPGDAENPEPFFYRRSNAPNGSAGSKKRSILPVSRLNDGGKPTVAATTFIQAPAG